MKYKSELINEIVENEGHCSPSLHYESECIGDWIESIRGAYPKLCDYEGEWLDYYLENGGIGKFPYLAINNIISTTVENTVPIPFKSAILKGCTIKTSKLTWLTGKYLDANSGNVFNGQDTHKYTEEFFECEPNTIYEVIGDNNYKKLCFYDSNKAFIIGYNSGTDSFDSLKQQSPSNACYLRISTSLTPMLGSSGEFSEALTVYNHSLGFSVIGTNLEDKLVSVEMPVLKTTGKNLFDINGELKTTYATYSINGDSLIVTGDWFAYQDVNLKPNTTYTLSCQSVKSESGYFKLGVYYNNLSTPVIFAKNTKEVTFTTPISFNDISVLFYAEEGNGTNTTTYTNIQLEENSVSTTYEPFKSNILTVNEEVELRGIGEVKDELDLVTGELTQRIEEIVLDGSEGWQIHAEKTNTRVFRLIINNLKKIDHHIISDRFPTNASGDDEKITNTGNTVYVAILKSKADNPNNFKSYLSQNPITVQYALDEESVKTVDLSIIDESGNTVSKLNAMNGITHIETNGTPLKPTFSGEIPVEAITQNLYSFIEEE